MHRWYIRSSVEYDSENPGQAMSHITALYPLYKFDSDTVEIHSFSSGALDWLTHFKLDLQLLLEISHMKEEVAKQLHDKISHWILRGV